MKFAPALCVTTLFLMALNTSAQQSPFDLSFKYLAPRTGAPSFNNVGLNVAFPIYKNRVTAIFTGLGTDYFHFTDIGDSLGIDRLYRVSIPMGARFTLNEHYTFTFLFDPTLGSDLEDLNMDDLRFNTAFRLQRTGQNKFSWSAGIGISKQFFGFQATPFYQLHVPVTPRLILSGALPLKPSLAWKIDENKLCGMAVSGTSNSFRLAERKNSRYVDSRQLEVNIFLQQRLHKNLRMVCSAGMAVLNRVSVYESNQTIPLRLFLFDLGSSRTPIASWDNRALSFGIKIIYITNNQ
ncbi:MAG: DUF6268 family outer membrane beta-barrel protein [Breznakibacter sp.]